MADRKVKRDPEVPSITPHALKHADAAGPKGRLLDAAFAKGREARLQGKPRSAPYSDYHGAAIAAAWEEGWDSAKPSVQIQEPEVSTRPIQMVVPGDLWPDNMPLPSHYRRPRPVPCPQCRSVKVSDRTQAVVVKYTFGTIAVFRCRVCGNEFRLPIVD